MSAHDRDGSAPSERDAAVERAWREASAEQPPAHLDATLVAAARDAVAARGGQPAEPALPSRRRSRTTPWLARWQPFAAAAAVAGLAFVLVPTMLSREEKLAPALQRPGPTSAPATAESHSTRPSVPDLTEAYEAPPAPAAAQEVRREPDVGTADQPLGQPEVPAPPASTAVPPPRASTEGAAADTTVPMMAPDANFGERSDARSKATASEGAGRVAPSAPAAAAAPPSSATRDRSADDAMVRDAAAWAATIEALHAAGDVVTAERELRAFRAADPDADSHLPDSLRAWAGTVK
jgi:hypothetical protein